MAFLGRTEAEIAWAIGLFEGEGHLGFSKSAGKKTERCDPRASLKMTDFDVVRRFHEIVGVGTIYETNPRCDRHNPTLQWRASGPEAIAFARVLIAAEINGKPMLGTRRYARAKELVRFYDSTYPRTCPTCRETFIARHIDTVYCSQHCGYIARKMSAKAVA